MFHKAFAFLLVFVLLIVVCKGFDGYENNFYEEENCKNASKVINKVPIYDLCYWNKIEWNNFTFRNDESPCNLHGKQGNYIASSCIPHTIRMYKDRAHIICDRTIGVLSTLNVVDLKNVKKGKECPKLECFSTCARNQLADIEFCDDSFNFLINVKDIQFNSFEEGWLFDCGAYRNGDKSVYNRDPRVCVYDVSVPKPGQYFCDEMPKRLFNEANQLAFTSMHLNAEEGLDNMYIYMFNAKSNRIICYSEFLVAWWAIESSYFRPEPSQSLFFFNLPPYKQYKEIMREGIYSGIIDKYGVYLSAKASDNLYFATHQELKIRCETNCTSDCDVLTYNIKNVGTYNPHGQTYGMTLNNDILYFIQPQNQALVCANRKDIITPDSIQYLAIDSCSFSHLTSIDIHKFEPNKKELFLLSNNLIDIKVNGFNQNKKNFIITYCDVDEIEALYPQCLSYFEDFHSDHQIKEEILYAQLIAQRKNQQDRSRKGCHDYVKKETTRHQCNKGCSGQHSMNHEEPCFS